jgi:stage V sporulation protein SpoVS
MRNKERFRPVLKGALGVMPSPEIAAEEKAAIAQDSSRALGWARGWLRPDGMNMKRAEALEQEGWNCCTRGTINR